MSTDNTAETPRHLTERKLHCNLTCAVLLAQTFNTRSSSTAKSTARTSCLVSVLYVTVEIMCVRMVTSESMYTP